MESQKDTWLSNKKSSFLIESWIPITYLGCFDGYMIVSKPYFK